MRTILIVEDDQDDMFYFDKAMNAINSKFDIHYATCSEDLFNILKRVYPDVLFLDIKLPGPSGIECLKILRSMRTAENVPIIIYTNYNEERFIDECYKAKANYYFLK